MNFYLCALGALEHPLKSLLRGPVAEYAEKIHKNACLRYRQGFFVQQAVHLRRRVPAEGVKHCKEKLSVGVFFEVNLFRYLVKRLSVAAEGEAKPRRINAGVEGLSFEHLAEEWNIRRIAKVRKSAQGKRLLPAPFLFREAAQVVRESRFICRVAVRCYVHGIRRADFVSEVSLKEREILIGKDFADAGGVRGAGRLHKMIERRLQLLHPAVYSAAEHASMQCEDDYRNGKED